MNEFDAEALVLGGYAVFLLLAAATLDVLARRSHRRSEGRHTAGFRYHDHIDAWVCPEGEHLWPAHLDRERRLVRYRARPQVCNRCPAKQDCTDSDDGREIVRFLDDWPRLEAGRFHRGLAVTLVALATLMTLAALVRHHDPAEAAALSGVLALSLVVGRHFAPAIRTG